MALKQYIGARYVPVIFGEWVSNHVYEPLTVVTYLNQSYTSKKAVPASVGNPASNPTYWAATGIYNSQVAELQDTVDEMMNDERHIVIISDSFGTKDGGGETQPYDLGEDFCRVSGWSASYVHFNGRNSAGFYNNYFESQLIQVIEDVGDDADLVKDIYIVGGYNDHNGTDATIQEKAAAFRTRANTAFPNANLHTVFVAYDYVTSMSVINDLMRVRKCYSNLTGYVDHANAFYTLHDPALHISGNGHPNANGIYEIARSLFNIVVSGTCNIYRYQTINVSDITFVDGTARTNIAGRIQIDSYNGQSTVSSYITNNLITMTTPKSLTLNNASWKLADIPPCILRGQLNNRGGNVTLQCYDSSNNLTLVPGLIAINDQQIYFVPETQIGTNGSNKSLTIAAYTFPLLSYSTATR